MQHERGGTRLRICTSAGEALPESVGNAWKARFGVDILDGVGSTELLHIFLSNAPGDIKYGTAGRPVPGYQVRLVNDSGADVPTARSAKCWSHAPSAGEGYWNQRSKSRSTFEGYWTRTGDKYIRDAEGRYTFCGRSDDMFKVSGIWVSPFEVESALITHPAVLEAAVVPEADPEGLLKPKAFVVLRADADDRRPARGAEGIRQAEDRGLEISALDRRRRSPCRKPRPAKSSASSCGREARASPCVVPANARHRRGLSRAKSSRPHATTKSGGYGSRISSLSTNCPAR